MSSDIAIDVRNLGKCFRVYATPKDRLKHLIKATLPRFLRAEVGKYFNEFWAVQEITFQIYKGETVGIIGRNGSGKSTLLQLICGTLNPTCGNLFVNGRIAALLELGSGFNPEFTGKENVYLNASLLGMSPKEIDSIYEAIVQFADIGDFINRPVKTYSSGMMVRLAFSVIAHVDADILVIDEALAVGDAFFTQKCMRFLRNFMKTGTVLFVSHDTSAITNLCSRAIWLEGGRVLEEGSPKAVSEYYLQAFYESQQGESTTTQLKKIANIPFVSLGHDQRQEFLNNSNLRNDIQVFSFNPEAPSFGRGHAQIYSVKLLDKLGRSLDWIVGGEDVTLRAEVLIHEAIKKPIIGFLVKDQYGQILFGDNTFITYQSQNTFSESGSALVAEFDFQFPRLAHGNYSIAVAVADGTQDNHIQHHWIHDAVIFKSESTSVASGLIGIPMKSINLSIHGPD